MRGMDNLRKMRLNKIKPAIVWVEMMPMQEWTKQYTNEPGSSVDIHLDDADIKRIELEDLRALVGLTVAVNGPNTDETERVARACFKAGASVVQAVFYDLSNPHNVQVVKGLRISSEGEKTVWQQ